MEKDETADESEPSKFDVGYSRFYFWDYFRDTPVSMIRIPGNVGAKLSTPFLPEYLQNRTILQANKCFVVIHSASAVSVAIENHDGDISLIVIDRGGKLPAGLRHKAKALRKDANLDNQRRDAFVALITPGFQWQMVMEVPSAIAKYWLKTPAKELLSYEKSHSYFSKKLSDERSSFLFNLLNLNNGMRRVAGNLYGEDELALRRENGKYFLYTRMVRIY